jgi:C1A family cysteine protease
MPPKSEAEELMADLTFQELSATLEHVSARWKAREKIRNYHLGYAPRQSDPSLEERERMAHAGHTRFMAAAPGAAPAYPPTVDWRNAPGGAQLPAGNYVTSIKDQGSCGCCVAFGTVAAFESSILIGTRAPGGQVDLSEADLFYCYAEPQGRTCAGANEGWWPAAALAVCANPGIVDEACFPYTAGDQPCNKCADWRNHLHAIGSSQTFTNTDDMKSWLAKGGPLITCMTVYEDFYQYATGVYHHVSGAQLGGHCICCVGYDDTQRFWICKNSWDTPWGDQGFFNIAYGECGIDATMWALTANLPANQADA